MNQLRLIEAQSEAVCYSQQAAMHTQQAVISAAKCGEALVKVKAGLGHGEFIPWIESNMPAPTRRCQKYIRLAREYPHLLEANTPPAAYLDIESELRMLSVDDDVEEVIRNTANDEGLTRKQITSLTKELETAKSQARNSDQWREKFLKEREANLALEQRKAEPVVDIDEIIEQKTAALKSEKEKLEAQLFRDRQAKDKAIRESQRKVEQAEVKNSQKIDDAVNARLKQRGESEEYINNKIENKKRILENVNLSISNAGRMQEGVKQIQESSTNIIFQIQDLFDDIDVAKEYENELIRALLHVERTVSLAKSFLAGDAGESELVEYMESKTRSVA